VYYVVFSIADQFRFLGIYKYSLALQGVSLNERQRLIPGSPAPAVLHKQQQEKQLQQFASDKKLSMPSSPKITLSKCKDNDIQRCDIPRFEDTMLEVGNLRVY
jgi:hypothetical protein